MPRIRTEGAGTGQEVYGGVLDRWTVPWYRALVGLPWDLIPAPTRHLSTLCNTTSKASEALFRLLYGRDCMHVVLRQIFCLCGPLLDTPDSKGLSSVDLRIP